MDDVGRKGIDTKEAIKYIGITQDTKAILEEHIRRAATRSL